MADVQLEGGTILGVACEAEAVWAAALSTITFFTLTSGRPCCI